MINEYILQVQEDGYDVYLNRRYIRIETYKTTLKLTAGMKYIIKLNNGIYKKIKIIDIMTYPIKNSRNCCGDAYRKWTKTNVFQ